MATNFDAKTTVGLKSPARQMKLLVETANEKRILNGADKLDLLQWLAEDLQESIETGKGTKLKLDDLYDFLKNEGKPSGDVATAIQALLALRLEQMARLCYKNLNDTEQAQEQINEQAEKDKTFMEVVVRKKTQVDLENLFGLEMVLVPEEPEDPE